ncbi:hypothetical protein [Variovorax arabinosiphilus]|uniref:hypothetical protein n=1 Tax=Variovorax arabinosiphilus TaxID=3053498 RepID=UPI002578530B|nr:hypothetical protein [Variovorax sp. J2R1-6]MDM0235370.1 hypothetical protein [Variovorax sp. J2R1-6]
MLARLSTDRATPSHLDAGDAALPDDYLEGDAQAVDWGLYDLMVDAIGTSS